MKISALVLAAGESKRMVGQNKLLLPFAGKTIVACAVDAILRANVAEAIVVLGHDAEAIRNALRERPLRFKVNANYRHGMTSSIHIGLAAISPSAQAVMISLADQPLIQTEELNFLIAEFSRATGKSIGVPTFNGQRGNPVIFDLCYRDEMLDLQGDAGCKSILMRHPEAVLEVTMPTGSILEDADTPEAYSRLLNNLLQVGGLQKKQGNSTRTKKSR
jgi:molybdenum cofactor cytidylyltransferase